MFSRVFSFIKSKLFLRLILLSFFIAITLSFWFWGHLIAFNEIYIFGNSYIRFAILVIFWAIIFSFFMLKPLMEFLSSLKSSKRSLLKAIKKEANHSLFKAKRNFLISLNDAKTSWKSDLTIKDLPLIIVIGNEGSGKSTFINYSNIEYPLSDSLESYKKLHQSTNNFSLYVSKKGALLDTEGNYFSQEELFTPTSSDELPEDDLVKNKDFLLKRNIWRNFLSFLKKNLFHSKLNGIILIIDTRLFLSNPKEYSSNLIRHLVKRTNECERILNLKLPIYIIFSKLDLVEGMKDFFDIFEEDILNKPLGISLTKINPKTLHQEFQELAHSISSIFFAKNNLIHSLDNKKVRYLFLKQLENLFALAKNFVLEIYNENSLKNNSFLKGVYFVSAYQENISRNFLLDAICEKYNIKKTLARANSPYNKRSYFVKSLLEDIIFKDNLSNKLTGIIKKTTFLFLMAIIIVGIYFFSSHLISTKESEKGKADAVLASLETLLQDFNYSQMDLNDKVILLINLKNILNTYPNLMEKDNLTQYISLKFSHQSFEEAKKLYYTINEDVLRNTLIMEMETILEKNENFEILIQTLYLYKSLFNEEYFNKDLLKIWVDEYWHFLSNYEISKETFLDGIKEFKKSNAGFSEENAKAIEIAINKIQKQDKFRRYYVLLNFLDSIEKKEFYKIQEDLGNLANNVFANFNKIEALDKIYTKRGMLEFLKTFNKKLDHVFSIDAWIFSENSEHKDDKKIISIEVIKMYLEQYKNQWLHLVASINSPQYSSKENTINMLNILSKAENPITKFIRIVSLNTNLNDPALLMEAYNLGLNATEIKNNFLNISNAFASYHEIAQQNSLLSNGVSAVGINIKNDTKIMEVISKDILDIYNKVVNFPINNTQTPEEKITYSINGSSSEEDAFNILLKDIKGLPNDIRRYYSGVSANSWTVIENYGISLVNIAWKNEVYSFFTNDIAPFYPFNPQSNQDLSMEAFKDFFGNNGILNNFYNKYLKFILTKKKNDYFINPKLNDRIYLSNDFLDFIAKTTNLSHSLLDANGNIKVKFTLQSLDLSADFSYIEMSCNANKARYDHTLNSTFEIIVGQFDSNTHLLFKAHSYSNPNIHYTKTYKGEWGWYRFLKESKSDLGYSIIFNENKRMYYDFILFSGEKETNSILNIISNFNITQNILGRK